MGYLNFKEGGKHHLTSIGRALRRRNLVMDEADEWEIHGPHPDMNYVVYVGRAYESLDVGIECSCRKSIATCVKHKEGFYVAVYPKAVYAIDESADWWRQKPEDRIPVKNRE